MEQWSETRTGIWELQAQISIEPSNSLGDFGPGLPHMAVVMIKCREKHISLP